LKVNSIQFNAVANGRHSLRHYLLETLMDKPRETDDNALDEALDETFPASDPAANTVETAVRPAPAPRAAAVIDNRELTRFELHVGSHVAFLLYERSAKTLTLVHTEVPAELRGQHAGDALAQAALDAARRDGLAVVAICPFVRKYLRTRGTESA
jgi:predicted GNAT family acetyltransferase